MPFERRVQPFCHSARPLPLLVAHASAHFAADHKRFTAASRKAPFWGRARTGVRVMAVVRRVPCFLSRSFRRPLPPNVRLFRAVPVIRTSFLLSFLCAIGSSRSDVCETGDCAVFHLYSSNSERAILKESLVVSAFCSMVSNLSFLVSFRFRKGLGCQGCLLYCFSFMIIRLE